MRARGGGARARAQPCSEMKGEWAPLGDPEFGADPGHRIKGFGKFAYALANKTGTGFNGEHAKYLKRTYGYIIKAYAREPDATAEDMVKRVRIGILQHACGDHSECNSEWCKAKLAEERGQVAPLPPAGHLMPAGGRGQRVRQDGACPGECVYRSVA